MMQPCSLLCHVAGAYALGSLSQAHVEVCVWQDWLSIVRLLVTNALQRYSAHRGLYRCSYTSQTLQPVAADAMMIMADKCT